MTIIAIIWFALVILAAVSKISLSAENRVMGTKTFVDRDHENKDGKA